MLRACVILAVLLCAATPVDAQDPVPPPNPSDFTEAVLDLDIQIPEAITYLNIGGYGTVDVIVKDISRDSTGGLAGAPSPAELSHEVSFSLTPLVEDPGWSLSAPSTLYMTGGQSRTVEAGFQVIGAT